MIYDQYNSITLLYRMCNYYYYNISPHPPPHSLLLLLIFLFLLSVLYVQQSLDGDAEEFLDPNKLSEDGTIALGSYEFSEDGEYFAYGLSEGGSDWNTIKVSLCGCQPTNVWVLFIPLAYTSPPQVKRVATNEDLSDEIKWVKFSNIAWTHDHKGFFYQVSMFILSVECNVHCAQYNYTRASSR